VLLNKREAADRLRVSIRTLDRLRAEGRIRAIKVRSAVRIADSEIQRFLSAQTKGR
jgi:excisionase family DNA binding protein